jgi:hypothetical protein
MNGRMANVKKTKRREPTAPYIAVSIADLSLEGVASVEMNANRNYASVGLTLVLHF